MNKDTFKIDSITWNDLGLSDIYNKLNKCVTSAGEDYLRDRLGNPYIRNCDRFTDYQRLSEEIHALDSSNKSGLKAFLEKTGKLKAYSYNDVINEYAQTEAQSNLKHVVLGILVVLAFGFIFVWPGPAIVAFFAIIAFSVSDYFKNKNNIAGKLMVFNYLIRMLKSIKLIETAVDVLNENKTSGDYSVLKERIETLKSIYSLYKPFMRGTFLISEGARTTSNPFSIVLDYVRIIFHADIIKYNSMISFLKEHISEAEAIYEIIGEIDCILCLDDSLDSYSMCKSELSVDNKGIIIRNGYHPLLTNPVANTVSTDRNMLITGCNASGKSTFLRMTALCALFSQSFGITFADEYKAPYYCILSSMSLKDDINASESYFMSEIKSLKRIIDVSKQDMKNNNKVLCVIDEVLRGTNTVERIAASVEILKSLSLENVLCIAATHDIELTELLKEQFDNYHFTEEISNDDINFSYIINNGPATTRNAIRLLTLLGYDEKLVKLATERADRFVSEGVWC